MSGDNAWPPPEVLEEALARINQPDWDAWASQVHAAGCCARPVRLSGRIDRADPDTGEVHTILETNQLPEHVLLKACGTRRATRCPACAAIYKADARILVITGLAGGKTVPASVADRPAVFATLTAPSYGLVHAVHEPAAPCHPTDSPPCPHDRSTSCRHIHPLDDPVVGGPLCSDCYDWAGTIIFNARVTDLWHRTIINTRRALATRLQIPIRQAAQQFQLAYLKVVEYQTRGLVHVHTVLRLDPVEDGSLVPITAAGLAAALLVAATRTSAPNPHHDDEPIRWGRQIDTAPIATTQRRTVTNYLAKYATKSTDLNGLLDHRLRHPDELDTTALPDHLKILVRICWNLGGQPHLAGLNLRDWAHTLGYRGHWLTKSRNWSTTFTALRAARHQWQRDQHGEADQTVIGTWTYQGTGYQTEGDTWLAHQAHLNRQANRRTAWEERT